MIGTLQRWILLGAVLLPLLLAACGKPATPTAGKDAVAPRAPAAGVPAQTGAGAPDRAIHPFRVEVTLSDAARQAFGKSGETVIVSASYFGDPKPGVDQRAVDDVGQIDLGRREIELPGAGIATFDGSSVAKDKLGLIAGAPRVNINVWSGRHSSQDNLLGCDMFQDTITVAARAPIRIHCALLTEPYESRQVTTPGASTT